ncbi:MAG: tetratricopeptide repeat protein, partial [Vicingaceae bacterium]|nr:tetratricopeptide repeat protein [Vicingaceae bacterium]
MKKYIYLFTLIFLAALLQAQNVPFDKKIFKERKDEFKEAKANLDMGNDIFGMYSPAFMEINDPDYVSRRINYREALPLLYKANKFNPNNAELNYKIGRCYLMNTVYKDES